MKKNLSLIIITVLAAVFISGCAAMVTVQPVTGVLYSDVKSPVAVTSNEGYSKTGTAQCTSILGWIAQGDASIEAAMKNGKITKIHHVDCHSTNILGIYATYTITVYGD